MITSVLPVDYRGRKGLNSLFKAHSSLSTSETRIVPTSVEHRQANVNSLFGRFNQDRDGFLINLNDQIILVSFNLHLPIRRILKYQ